MAATRMLAASPIGSAAPASVETRGDLLAALTPSTPEETNTAIGAQHDRRSRLRRYDLAVEHDRALQTQATLGYPTAFVALCSHPRTRPTAYDRQQCAPRPTQRGGDAGVT